MPVPLCRVAHDEAHHASRQHDLEIITVLHLVDDECQEQSDAETEHNAQRQRMHLASEHTNEDTGDDARDCGPDNDASSRKIGLAGTTSSGEMKSADIAWVIIWPRRLRQILYPTSLDSPAPCPRSQ